MVKPIRESSVELRGITMDSYVGYRKITLAKIWSEALWGIPTSFPEDNGSKSDEKDGTK